MGSLEASPSFVVIQTAFLGDIALTSSFLRDLRALYPQAKISFVTTPGGVDLFTPNPWQIDCIPFAKRGADSGVSGFFRLVKKVRALLPERVYCLHRSARSQLLAFFSGAMERLGFKEAALSFLNTKRVSRKDYLYEAEKNRALLLAAEKALPILAEPFPELFVSKADEQEADRLLGEFKNFVAISPSSVWATKRWPAERFGQVAKWLWETHQLPIVILGNNDPVDLECAKKLIAAADLPPEAVVDLTGRTSLGVLKAVLAQAKVLLCNDSAPLHLAISQNTPVVAVFGSTTKELGFFPLAPAGRSQVVELTGLSCRPCGLHGHQRCPLGHFRCMLDLSSARVVEALVGFI